MKVHVIYVESKTTKKKCWEAHDITVQSFKGGRGLIVLLNKKGKKIRAIFYRKMEYAEKVM